MATWNPWHGCTKVSSGCSKCYVYRRDSEFGKDASVVRKTASFDLPIKKDRRKQYKLQPDGEYIYTCFTSDFFHPAADEWRIDAWAMMRQRPDIISGATGMYIMSHGRNSTRRRQRPGWTIRR